MTPEELDFEAAALYAECVAERGPRWDQLGEVTRDVWRGCVRDGLRARLD